MTARFGHQGSPTFRQVAAMGRSFMTLSEKTFYVPCLLTPISQLFWLNRFKSTKSMSKFLVMSSSKNSAPPSEKTLFISCEILELKSCIRRGLENAGNLLLPSKFKIQGSNGVPLNSCASILICCSNCSCVKLVASRKRLGLCGINTLRVLRYALSWPRSSL